MGGGLRGCRGIQALIHPTFSVHPLFSLPRRGLVRAHVLGQVVVPHKHPGAQGTAELLGASVCL